MTVAVSKLSEQDQQQRAALVERLFQAQIASLEMLSIYIGERLGLYRTLDREGPLTPIGLARAAGIHERYAREWLEHQAVAGFVSAWTASARRQISSIALMPANGSDPACEARPVTARW